MAKKLISGISLETCQFILFSELPISDQAKDSISNSSYITFGDASRTMVTLGRIKSEMLGTNKDEETMDALIEAFGGDFYVDLEN